MIIFFSTIMKVLLYFVWFSMCYVGSSSKAAFGKKVPPLLEERGHRKMHSNSECVFGKQHKELGSSWFADLGPPFDVMYCIKCECLKVFKEGRVYGHVKCKNMAKDCQELTCEEPVQVVGRCCKVCRNETDITEILQDVTPNPSEEEEKSHKHYAALLTNSFYTLHNKDSENMSSVNSIGQTATGRFTLHKRNLYYSFYASNFPLPTRPKSLQFVDTSGNIVEEQQLPSSASLYQNATGKICGVWKRIPSEYRNALKEEKLSVILVWEEYDVKIRGSLKKYRPLTTEMFSSLMTAPNDSLTDAAGTALVSISTVTPSVHIMVVFTGILSSKRKNDNLLLLRLFEEERPTAIFEETISLEKLSSEVNVIEHSTAVSAGDLLALTQQRLTVSVLSARYRDSKIQGKVVSRVQCELQQAVLSPLHSNPPGSKYPHSQKHSKASGLAWMFINRHGMLQYSLTLDNVAEASVELVTHRHQVLVDELLEWPNGTLRLGPKYLEQLYSDDLAINVARTNGNNPSLIRGRLTSRLVADSRDSTSPYLLKRSDTSVPVDMVGLIWARIDGECSLHFDINIVGKDVEDRQFELYLEDTPFLAPGAPFTRRLLEEFSGGNVESYSFGMLQSELARLESGVVFFDIRDMKRAQSVLKARWEKVIVPESCLPQIADNSTADNTIPSYRLLQEENDQPEISKCFHGTQYYDYGTQWTSTLDDCTMCNCNHGVTRCDTILCPDLSCPQKFTVPGSCCPSCTNVSTLPFSSQIGCTLGGQSYPPGSAWYPYVPPNGFATCTVCTCDPLELQVKCSRVACPPLNCDEKVAYRPERKSCCKVCPNRTTTANFDATVGDQMNVIKFDRDILAAGGCKYPYEGPFENGKEWHPKLYPHGVEKCVTCRCKDSKISCERKKCVKHSCDDPCCSKKSKCGKKRLHGEDIRRREKLPRA